MSNPTPKVTVKGNRPDALDDAFRMQQIAPYLAEGIELAAARMRDENRAGPFGDLVLSAARRFVAQSIQVAGSPEHVPPVGE